MALPLCHRQPRTPYDRWVRSWSSSAGKLVLVVACVWSAGSHRGEGCETAEHSKCFTLHDIQKSSLLKKCCRTEACYFRESGSAFKFIKWNPSGKLVYLPNVNGLKRSSMGKTPLIKTANSKSKGESAKHFHKNPPRGIKYIGFQISLH